MIIDTRNGMTEDFKPFPWRFVNNAFSLILIPIGAGLLWGYEAAILAQGIALLIVAKGES